MNLWMKQAFVVKKADGKNRCITYKLKAVLQHQEKQYLLMQAQTPYALADGLMMLEVQPENRAHRLSVVEDLMPFTDVLHRVFGANTMIH
ncbi:MAG: hypothetical protein ACLUO4_09010 [Christensenellales bacterium]